MCSTTHLMTMKLDAEVKVKAVNEHRGLGYQLQSLSEYQRN